jgi:predicted extracellular nuclease
MRTSFLLVSAMSFVLSGAPALGGELYVACWNVENLFDTVDDPAVEKDEEFIPTAKKKWTEERFETKCRRLARVIKDMNKRRGPDILGLCEVENRAVIEALISALELRKRDYGIVHKDSPSTRGIDCALIYDQGKVKLKSSDFIAVKSWRTRDIVEAEFAAGEYSFFVFVNHWTARMGASTFKGRVAAAKTLRKRIDEIFTKDSKADILVIGNLNDEPVSDSIREHLKASTDRESLEEGDLFNPMGPLHEDPNKGTCNYGRQWLVLDHVIMSQGLLSDKGFRWKPDSLEVVVKNYQLYKPGTPQAKHRYFGGYSDHLPVACVIEY